METRIGSPVGTRPDDLDKDVYTNTMQLRKIYYDACDKLHIPPRKLTPVTLMQRSVPE